MWAVLNQDSTFIHKSHRFLQTSRNGPFEFCQVCLCLILLPLFIVILSTTRKRKFTASSDNFEVERTYFQFIDRGEEELSYFPSYS